MYMARVIQNGSLRAAVVPISAYVGRLNHLLSSRLMGGICSQNVRGLGPCPELGPHLSLDEVLFEC